MRILRAAGIVLLLWITGSVAGALVAGALSAAVGVLMAGDLPKWHFVIGAEEVGLPIGVFLGSILLIVARSGTPNQTLRGTVGACTALINLVVFMIIQSIYMGKGPAVNPASLVFLGGFGSVVGVFFPHRLLVASGRGWFGSWQPALVASPPLESQKTWQYDHSQIRGAFEQHLQSHEQLKHWAYGKEYRSVIVRVANFLGGIVLLYFLFALMDIITGVLAVLCYADMSDMPKEAIVATKGSRRNNMNNYFAGLIV